MTEGPAFYTTQDTGVFSSAYTVFSRAQLVAELEARDYELVDSWVNPQHHCRIFGAPRHSIVAYSGFYFRRAASAS